MQQHQEWWHDEPVQGKHHLAVTHILLRISYAMPAHVNVTCCVCHKQQTMTVNFSSSYNFTNQKAHYTSLFFTCLHYWCWTITRSPNLTSSTVNKGLVHKGTLSLWFPESPLDVHAVSKSHCYKLARHESYAWWPVFIWLPLIYITHKMSNYGLQSN
jgi:hypothetical protein